MIYQIVISNWQEALFTASANVMTNVVTFLPTLIGALIVLLAGLLLAKWSKAVIIKFLRLIKLSNLVKKGAIRKFLNQAEVTGKVEEILGEVVRWLIILVFFIAAVNLLGLTTVSAFLNSILTYVPKVVSAVLVLTVGVVIAGVVESVVKGAVSSVDVSTGRLMGKITGYIVVVFTIMAAITELGIAQQFLSTFFIGFVAMLALSLGLAFGLGSKDVVAKIMDEWYSKLKKDLKK